ILDDEPADNDIFWLLGERGAVDPLAVEHGAGRAEIDVAVLGNDLAERVGGQGVRSRRQPERRTRRRLQRLLIKIAGYRRIDYDGARGRRRIECRLVIANRSWHRRFLGGDRTGRYHRY